MTTGKDYLTRTYERAVFRNTAKRILSMIAVATVIIGSYMLLRYFD